MKQENVLERVYQPKRLIEAWQQVKYNAGTAGIDRMTVSDFEARIKELFPKLRNKVREGKWRFKPARRVEIPKEGRSGKMRKLGIPVVMDRIVSTSMQGVFENIFGIEFTASNYGFRRGKSQHMAINHVKKKVEQGYIWCASIDLKSFFDEIPHNLILKLIRRKISDERLVTLVARALKAGVVVDGKFQKTTKGCPQGSPLSPMLSNIVLNELDQELEKRKLNYCRWADDFVILTKSERAATRVMEGITRFLENKLGLLVNKDKSKVAKVRDVTFLGVNITSQKIKISEKALIKFKGKVRSKTKRNNPFSTYWIVQDLNKYLRGWTSYFRIQEMVGVFEELDRWIRNRLRSMQLKKWKKPKKFQRMMRKAGFDTEESKETWINMRRWRSVNRKEVLWLLSLEWFRKLGLFFLDDYSQKPLKV